MRVCISPTYRGADKADGGIRRVIEAMERHLPDLGWQIVDDPAQADVVNVHGAMPVPQVNAPIVSSTHGLYWDDYEWDHWAYDANNRVIDSLTRADAVTAPSQWVAHAITRGMLARPTVVYHGVDADAWARADEPMGYVLWNKARTDPVSDPAIVMRLAGMLHQTKFVTTFGHPDHNVYVTGAMPYEQMRPVIQRAGVYLATARETFGIGTLEALAAGVPVAGWRFGGQAEIVIEGETGYLAEPGDDEGLAYAVLRCLEERQRLCANAQQDARDRWGWQDKIAQYAAVFAQAVEEWNRPRPKVSVVVTCHNLARYLGDALASVQAQTMTDWECVIVDDASEDDTPKVTKEVTKRDKRFRYLKTPQNLKLSGARNYGWQHSTGRYVCFLDADDMLDRNALDALSGALDRDNSIHIAFGHLDIVNDEGAHRQRNPWPGAGFDWYGQIAHLNQLPYAALMRRSVLERSGGYRTRDWRAEDAALWTRLTSFGFRARKVTEDATLIYRLRSDSKSNVEAREHEDRDGDWTAWFPWRMAGSAEEGLQAVEDRRRPNPRRVPWGAQGVPPKPLEAWPVRHHQQPAVSVVIPVGPGHAKYLVDALDSLVAQTMPDWEAIVVNDSGLEIDLTPWPWARMIYSTGGIIPPYDPLGAGAARNAGIAAARAPLVLFLDADDVLVPRALEVMLELYVASEGKYVYSDWGSPDDDMRLDGTGEVFTVRDYDPLFWLDGMHPVTALISTEDVRRVGGFDETLPAWEDWDFFIKLAGAGVCGIRAAEPLLIYRQHSGTRRKTADAKKEALLAEIKGRYDAYRTGAKPMASCCGGNTKALAVSQHALAAMQPPPEPAMEAVRRIPPEATSVRLEFIGDTWGAQSYVGRPSGRVYRGGANPLDKYQDVDPRDVERLVSLGVWRVVEYQPDEVPA